MMTQQYSVLRYATYFAILVFHVSVLFLLYNYSTQSLQDHLVGGNIGQQQREEDSQLDEILKEPQEAKVTLQHDALIQTPMTQANLGKDPLFQEKLNELPISYLPELVASHQEQVISNATKQKLLVQEQLKKVASQESNSSAKAINTKKPEARANNLAEQHTNSTRSTLISQANQLDNPINSHSTTAQQYIPSNNMQDTNKRPTISPAVFFQAFKDSYYQEQTLFGNPQAIANQSNASNGNNSEAESLINQRLGELKIADYIQQIKKAFQEAARRTPGMYLNSGKELKTDLDVRLEIQSQGTVKIAKFQSSGITEIDDYIKKFLLDIIVNPIPKRYKVKALPFSTKILINIDKNTRFYTIRCFF